jgi:hypothetical protein
VNEALRGQIAFEHQSMFPRRIVFCTGDEA